MSYTNLIGEDVDGFECDQQYRAMLGKNLSANQIKKIVHFSYNHSFHHLQLFHSLLTTIKDIHVVSRLTAFYVLDALMKESGKKETSFDGYKLSIKTHLEELVRPVLEGGIGATNAGAVKKVLLQWLQANLIEKHEYDSVLPLITPTITSTKIIDSNVEEITTYTHEQINQKMEQDRERVIVI
jgi:hypothetical protein